MARSRASTQEGGGPLTNPAAATRQLVGVRQFEIVVERSSAGAIIDDADDAPIESPTSGRTANRRLTADGASPAGKRGSLRPVKRDEVKGGRS